MIDLAEKMTYADKPWVKSYFVGPFKLPKTMEPYPKIPVYKFLEDSATSYPEQIACVYLDKEMTYPELKLHVDKLATALADLGVKKGDKVATILPNCPQFIISDYAIMRLGAVHVPISILHKAPDLLYELGESGAETVICSYRRLERVYSIRDKTKLKNIIFTPVPIFPDYSLPEMEEVRGAHRLEDLMEKYEPNPPKVEINPTEDLALLPFTGGTTGVPKGTMLTHYNITTNVIQSVQWMMKPLAAGFKGKASALICVPIFHQYGHWALHAGISWGLRGFLVDPRDLDRIVEIIKKHRPFMVLGVPTHYMLLLDKDLQRIPIFFYSGAAALPPDVAKEFEKKVGVPMGEGYGMTEATAATHVNLSALSKVTGFIGWYSAHSLYKNRKELMNHVPLEYNVGDSVKMHSYSEEDRNSMHYMTLWKKPSYMFDKFPMAMSLDDRRVHLVHKGEYLGTFIDTERVSRLVMRTDELSEKYSSIGRVFRTIQKKQLDSFIEEGREAFLIAQKIRRGESLNVEEQRIAAIIAYGIQGYMGEIGFERV